MELDIASIILLLIILVMVCTPLYNLSLHHKWNKELEQYKQLNAEKQAAKRVRAEIHRKALSR